MSDLVSYLYWERGRHLGLVTADAGPRPDSHNITTIITWPQTTGRSAPAGFQDDRRESLRNQSSWEKEFSEWQKRISEKTSWEKKVTQSLLSSVMHLLIGGLWWLISDLRLSQQHGRTLTLTAQRWHNCHTSHILENFTETRHSLYSIEWWS